MIIKVHNATNFAQVANSLARDPRLNLAATGLMTMILSYPHNWRLSVEGLLRELNKGKQKNQRIGVKGLRKLTQQMSDAGYLRIKAIHDGDGKFKGKEWHVSGISLSAKVPHDPNGDVDPEAIPILDQEQVVPDDLDVSDGDEAAATQTLPANFPAAKVFMEVMGVSLDAETINFIESQVKGDHDIWEKAVWAHKSGMTPQQKSSESFRTKAVKFCLEDYDRMVVRIGQMEMKDQYKQGPFQPATDEPKRKSFSEHIEQNGYTHGSTEYTKFKTNWIERHTAKGNAAALQEVEDYEGIRRTLADAKKRKGSISQ